MELNLNKNSETAFVKQDTIILDFMKKIEKEIVFFKVLYFDVGRLQNKNLKNVQRQAMIETFENVVEKSKGGIFSLPNDDIVVFYNKKFDDEILACLVKIRFMFYDDPVIRDADDLEQTGFVCFYSLSSDTSSFRKKLQESMNISGTEKTQTSADNTSAKKENLAASQTSVFNSVVNAKKLKKELNPDILAKLQKILSVADFSSFIRRQAICAVIGKAPPQRIFEEVYVSIPDLRDMLLPDVDLVSNPWLFLSLSETLDKRVLETIGRHDDGSLAGNFSININVSTLLSDDFLAFDDNINASMRSSIILELQLVDILSDIKAFMLAKTFAQARGYKVCVDGVSVDKLKFLNRKNLDCDLIKVIWHPSFIDIIQEDTHFMDYINKAERSKLILCRIDDAQAIEIGNSLGINLYQGRYIQRLLNAQPRKTIFVIKK